MRLRQAATQWLESVHDLAPSTFADYESVVRCHIIPLWGDKRVHKLSREVISSALVTVSPGRRRRVLAVLRLILASQDISLSMKTPSRDAKPRLVMVPPIPHVEALAHELLNYGDLVRFAAGSGLRWGEIVALEPSDIEGDVVSVTKAWCTRSGTIKEPKSPASVRKVLVLPFAHSALQNALTAPERHLFATESGNRLHQPNFGKKWRAARERLGMEWRFHDLRHTYATALIEQGVSSVALCAMLGHSKPSVTYDIYAGFFSDPVDTVRQQLERGAK